MVQTVSSSQPYFLCKAFLVKSTSTVHHWIGLTDQGMEGNWRWVDGTPFNPALSNGSEPERIVPCSYSTRFVQPVPPFCTKEHREDMWCPVWYPDKDMKTPS
ncbi:C-type lectin domain family 4 member F [Cricetulus griseus]|uniref:C-type lectin domain family 4 member F n=1 Tax=Cricetulus griseus TaxID=10029 RepID=G3I6F1_CRIGR|nr:C-type lectin domain family 4 member F [Cricetulus griseus]